MTLVDFVAQPSPTQRDPEDPDPAPWPPRCRLIRSSEHGGCCAMADQTHLVSSRPLAPPRHTSDGQQSWPVYFGGGGQVWGASTRGDMQLATCDKSHIWLRVISQAFKQPCWCWCWCWSCSGLVCQLRAVRSIGTFGWYFWDPGPTVHVQATVPGAPLHLSARPARLPSCVPSISFTSHSC